MTSRTYVVGLVLMACAGSSAAFPQSCFTITSRPAGPVFLYSVRLVESRKVKSGNSVSFRVPGSAAVDEQALLKVEVLPGDDRTGLRLCTSFEALSSDTHLKTHSPLAVSPQEGRGRIGNQLTIAATIEPDGGISDVEGLAELLPEQQQLWKKWASSFALAAAFAGTGGRRGGVSLADIQESSSELDGLGWSRELEVAGDQACYGYSLGTNREPTPSSEPLGSCAKLIVKEKLTQRANLDQTPQPYRTRNLEARGTAHGRGETRAELCTRNGWVVKSVSQSEQHLDVVLARTDKSDSIKYNVDTKTHLEVRLITDSLLAEATH